MAKGHSSHYTLSEQLASLRSPHFLQPLSTNIVRLLHYGGLPPIIGNQFAGISCYLLIAYTRKMLQDYVTIRTRPNIVRP